jgi:hypothetical protein
LSRWENLAIDTLMRSLRTLGGIEALKFFGANSRKSSILKEALYFDARAIGSSGKITAGT